MELDDFDPWTQTTEDVNQYSGNVTTSFTDGQGGAKRVVKSPSGVEETVFYQDNKITEIITSYPSGETMTLFPEDGSYRIADPAEGVYRDIPGDEATKLIQDFVRRRLNGED